MLLYQRQAGMLSLIPSCEASGVLLDQNHQRGKSAQVCMYHMLRRVHPIARGTSNTYNHTLHQIETLTKWTHVHGTLCSRVARFPH
ncbi:hypothetical protein F4781DRAFT_417147 [Annulohypoxylon bovei var. microspora]|nr:hypothetical protein F4781DRAFT_417147 [Annulohypoxylon bovei var. microspora]